MKKNKLKIVSKPKIVSIFSGAGGVEIGFEKAGFQTVFSTDIWETACETLKVNFPEAEVVCSNIADIDFKKIKKKYGPISGLIGGPPCPPFSKSRFYRKEMNRGIDDEDGFLTVSNYFRAVKQLEPIFFFFENVHGFVYKPHQSALDLVESESKRLGYITIHQVLNAADYGVPQTRQRFICIGVKEGYEKYIFPSKTNFEKPVGKQKPWVTCGDILSDIDFDLPEDIKMIAGSKDSEILKQIPPGDNYLYFTKERNHPKPLFKWRSRYWSFLLKLSPNRPSWTIQASHSNNMGPFHWKNRFLRIQEIKRIQSFPDSFKLSGGFKDQWRQVGNAVPPRLAYTIAKQIIKQYF